MGDKKPTSETKKETWHTEIYTGIKPHSVTKITGEDKSVEGRGRTAKDSEKAASDKWGKKK